MLLLTASSARKRPASSYDLSGAIALSSVEQAHNSLLSSSNFVVSPISGSLVLGFYNKQTLLSRARSSVNRTTGVVGRSIFFDEAGAVVHDFGWHGDPSMLGFLNDQLAAQGLPLATEILPNPQDWIPPVTYTAYRYRVYLVVGDGQSAGEGLSVDQCFDSDMAPGTVRLDQPGVIGYAIAPDGTLYKAPWASP